MELLRKTFFLLLGLALVAWSMAHVLKQPAPAKYQPAGVSTPVVHTAQGDIKVDIADTDALREQGLSGREALASDQGMLFVFETPGTYGFWMKDMKFPLDMVWIDEFWTVVGVERGMAPESYPKVFMPSAAVKYVLELPAGQAAAHGIDTGSKLFLDQ